MENPVTRRITLPVRYEADFLDGPYKVTKDTFEIDQAVLPFRVNDDWALITRTKLPVVVQPPKDRGQSWASGLSNGYTTFFLSPERGEGMYWGVGPVLYYPSSNPTVGVKKWGSGPSAAFITEDQSPWVFGAVVNNIWSFGGPGGTNQLFLNPFVDYHFADGWSVGSSPEITTNWIASGGKWTSREHAPKAQDFVNRRYRHRGVVDEVERAKNRTKSKVRARACPRESGGRTFDRGHQAGVRLCQAALSRAEEKHPSPARDLRAGQSVHARRHLLRCQ